MALPTSGKISLAEVADALGRPGTAISLNDPDVRALAGKPTGPISLADLLGAEVAPAGATLVAGASDASPPHDVGFEQGDGVGSLTAIDGISIQPNYFADFVASGGSRIGQVRFAGDVTAELAGKHVYVDGVKVTMNGPTFASFVTTWQVASGGFGFVNGQTYTVSFGS